MHSFSTFEIEPKNNYNSEIINYHARLNNFNNKFLSCLEMSLDRLYILNKKISEADNLTIKEELEAQKRLDISTKTLASASIFVLELKNIELQVSAIEEKLKNISKDNV